MIKDPTKQHAPLNTQNVMQHTSYNTYPPTPALAKAGAAPGTTEGVEPELSKSLLFWARKQKRQQFALARLWALGSVPDCGPYWPLEQPASGFWTLQTLQNLALARLWALGSARLWAELRRLWARGSGASNPFFLVARNCPSNASNPSNPSNASTLANGCAIRLDSGRFRRSMDASDAPKPRTC